MPNHTKRELAASLKRLLKEKPLDKITISELTKDSGYSRMTFYYHFRDIYDLVEWMCLEDLRQSADEPTADGSWQEWLTRVLGEIHAQKAYVGNLNRSLDRTQIENFWTEQIYSRLLLMVRSGSERCCEEAPDEQKIRFIASFYRYGFVGILMEWFDQGMKDDYAQIVAALSVMLEGGVEHSIRNMMRAGDMGGSDREKAE